MDGGILLETGGLHRRLLGNQSDGEAGRGEPFAIIRLGLAGENPQQRRLAGGIAADQTGPRPWLQPKVDMLEQSPAPIDQTDVAQLQKRCRHGRRLGRNAINLKREPMF